MSVKDVSMPHEKPDSGAEKPVILITGASSGIGAATARLAFDRYCMVLAAR
jgi:NADP-dependent 3-hydroxy acid dehydrogenase YdfG